MWSAVDMPSLKFVCAFAMTPFNFADDQITNFPK